MSAQILRADFRNSRRHTEAEAMGQIRRYCADFNLSPEQTQRCIERARKSFRENPPTPYQAHEGIWAKALMRLQRALLPSDAPQPPRSVA